MAETTVLDKIAKLFFVDMPVELILQEGFDDRRFPAERLAELMGSYYREYSDTEAKMISEFHLERTEKHSVFEALAKIAAELLVVKNNQPCCRYETILRWRDISQDLGEDLLTCAFLADDSQKNGRDWSDFNWNIVLGHDNKQLNGIMQQGLSDNHFHLYGSAPIFPLIWIRLMNDIHHGKYMTGLMGMEKTRRHFQYDISGMDSRFLINARILQAALMRVVMYQALQEKSSGKNVIDAKKSWQILQSGNLILHERAWISGMVQDLRLKTFAIASDGTMAPDYTLCGRREPEMYSNWLFSGERKLIYEMLRDIFGENRLPETVHRMLYPYLVIRTWFRKELVQSNDKIGFENFSVYNRRKGFFLPVNPTASEKRVFWETRERKQNMTWMVQHAVLESFCKENLQSLEIRITPEDDFAANVKQIETYDRLLRKRNEADRKQEIKLNEKYSGVLSEDQFFYVLHFAKSQEKSKKEKILIECRHDSLRKKLNRQKEAILKMRRLRPQIACRVRGIDACAMEIGCRPEVFACVFRRLRMDVDPEFSEEKQKLPQLSVTYHVGEDFLDPVDGLRAIDEAVRFLEMGSGDRLGHATVLGLDLKKWYEKKGYYIHLHEQDYLDNVMWFYMMILEFQMEGCELLKEYLHQEFIKFFHRIYENGEKNVGLQNVSQMTIYNYYEAWKLRGDIPERYRTGRYIEPEFEIAEPGVIAWENKELEEMRKDPLISELYCRYHFDKEVREKGERVIEKRVPELYIQGVLCLQKCMQKKVAQKGIGIEVNPSSNLLISTMDSYAEHPVLNLYSLGLCNDQENAQMFVSINTDDRGVFHTSLENEYALLASSVENLRDKNGEKLYTPQQVYEWLDRIRVMGNYQVF